MNSENVAIWVDREQASLFRLTASGSVRKYTALHSMIARVPVEESLDHIKRNSVFFNEIAHELHAADQILILGPGVAKHHFQTYLVEQHPELARRIVGCSSLEHPTELQVKDLAQRFFKLKQLA